MNPNSQTPNSATKAELHQLIDQTHDQELLDHVKLLLEPELWDSLSNSERTEIEKAIADLDAGLGVSQAESERQDKETIENWGK